MKKMFRTDSFDFQRPGVTPIAMGGQDDDGYPPDCLIWDIDGASSGRGPINSAKFADGVLHLDRETGRGDAWEKQDVVEEFFDIA